MDKFNDNQHKGSEEREIVTAKDPQLDSDFSFILAHNKNFIIYFFLTHIYST
jgi:hypothetical protein